MKARNFVMVYQDPYTREKKEGVAILIAPVPADECPYLEDGLEYWEVMFTEDQEEQTFKRRVGPETLNLSDLEGEDIG